MANRKARVPQADIARALKAVRGVGMIPTKLEILEDGEIRILLSASTNEELSTNEWDLGLAEK